MIYSEATVRLRFRADHLIGYDELCHKLQLCSMDHLTEFWIVEDPRLILDTAAASSTPPSEATSIAPSESGANGAGSAAASSS